MALVCAAEYFMSCTCHVDQVSVLMSDQQRLTKRARLSRAAANKLCSQAQRDFVHRKTLPTAASDAQVLGNWTLI